MYIFAQHTIFAVIQKYSRGKKYLLIRSAVTGTNRNPSPSSSTEPTRGSHVYASAVRCAAKIYECHNNV